MAQCSLCGGRAIKTEFGSRCMNKACEGSNEAAQEGYRCITCNTSLLFKRNNAYGDRTYWCEGCQKEMTI